MDETFSFRAPTLPLHRRVDRRVVKLAVASVVVLAAVTTFSRWVIDSERRSEAGASGRTADEPMIGMLRGASVGSSDEPGPPAADDAARADARFALEAAREAMHGAGSIADAGPGQLSTIEPSLVFTDGPSPASGIVSVATTGRHWAAAVMGDTGTCYWIALGPDGASFGSGELCTGTAALASSGSGWS